MKNGIKVKIKRVGGHKGDLPRYVSPGSSGLDLTAFVKDENGEIVIAPGKIELVPTHGCTTINLHDVFYPVRGDDVEGIWEISARGRFA